MMNSAEKQEEGKVKTILIMERSNPECFGSVDEELISEMMNNKFILVVTFPFFNPEIIFEMHHVPIKNCRGIVGFPHFPYVKKKSYLLNFAIENYIPFKPLAAIRKCFKENPSLLKAYAVRSKRYMLYKGMVCFNLAEAKEDMKLLIVYIPEETKNLKKLDLSYDPYLIGLSANTVNMHGIQEMIFSGKVYGECKYSSVYERWCYVAKTKNTYFLKKGNYYE